ncbi:hypothetical protein [Veillonella montpellierensis]|uniref:hypothetical protein n=1 Tax=Veillonella montpellierensis TaxID=187328 RepID=UPI0023F75BB9|nr:hypothetical protein [Veillonella montpellierensis]
MDKIIEECAKLDYAWLPSTVGDFSLTIDTCIDGDFYRLFHYQNQAGWRWEALYDKEVEDYTVHIVMPLFSFVDINFIKTKISEFWHILQERMVQEMEGLFISPENRFTYQYREKGLVNWDFSKYLPSSVGPFTCDITPSNAIKMINGSYIIAEYKDSTNKNGLLLFYNVFRDEFFAELRHHNYPEINHDLDADSIAALEVALDTSLITVLRELENRL